MRLLISLFAGSALLLFGCGDNKGKVDTGGEVKPDPNAKPQNLGTHAAGGSTAKKAKTK